MILSKVNIWRVGEAFGVVGRGIERENVSDNRISNDSSNITAYKG